MFLSVREVIPPTTSLTLLRHKTYPAKLPTHLFSPKNTFSASKPSTYASLLCVVPAGAARPVCTRNAALHLLAKLTSMHIFCLASFDQPSEYTDSIIEFLKKSRGFFKKILFGTKSLRVPCNLLCF